MRYFFRLHECGDVTRDVEGLELPSLVAAERNAIDAARGYMCGELQQGHLCLGCCIVIEDRRRHELSRVWFRDAVAVTGIPG